MEFLLELGLSDNDIEEIKKNNDEAVLKNIVLNKDNVKQIVNYFKEIGVSDASIKDLFVLQIGMFHRTKDEIVSVFDEYELESIIKSLNYDVNTVDLIEFS